MSTLYFVGPWDLNRDLACVPDDPADGVVLLVESRAKGSALPWHRKKLALVLSAIRHFAEELRAAGYRVELVNAENEKIEREQERNAKLKQYIGFDYASEQEQEEATIENGEGEGGDESAKVDEEEKCLIRIQNYREPGNPEITGDQLALNQSTMSKDHH